MITINSTRIIIVLSVLAALTFVFCLICLKYAQCCCFRKKDDPDDVDSFDSTIEENSDYESYQSNPYQSLMT